MGTIIGEVSPFYALHDMYMYLHSMSVCRQTGFDENSSFIQLLLETNIQQCHASIPSFDVHDIVTVFAKAINHQILYIVWFIFIVLPTGPL